MTMRTTLSTNRIAQLAAATALVALTLGCGGGGSSDSAAPADSSAPAESSAPAAPAGDYADGPLGSASVSGTVNFEGDVPKLAPVAMAADPGCAAKHSDPVENEMLVLGEGNTMANILVFVSGGLPAGPYPAPSGQPVLDQDGCKYVPHVMGVRANQEILIKNSDGLLHNIHALPDANKEFNKAMPAAVTEMTHTFPSAEEPFVIKCDVHPWMGAYVGVFDHPYFSVTDTTGSFSIDGLPAGEYELTAWHEKMPAQTATITVGDGEVATSDFTFSR